MGVNFALCHATHSCLRFLLTCLLLFGVLHTPGLAQSFQSRIVVTVRDEHGRPLALARVDLSGEANRFGYTTPEGVATFDHLEQGQYIISVHVHDYAPLRSQPVALQGEEASVTVDLVQTSLKKIGHILVTTKQLDDPHSVTIDGDTRGVLEPDLVQALGDLGDVSSTNGRLAVGSALPQQTGFSIDGIPVAPGSGLTQNLGFNSDLAQSALSDVGAGGGAAGRVSFFLLQPSRKLEALGALRAVDNGDTLLRVATRGSLKNVGFVVQHVERSAHSPLDGLTFRDQSGLAYEHNGASKSKGNLVRLRWTPTINETLSVSGLNSTTSRGFVCPYFTALFPCGSGNGSSATQAGHVFVISNIATVGDSSIVAGLTSTASRTSTSGLTNESEGLSNFTYATQSFYARLEAPVKQRDRLSLTAERATTRTRDSDAKGAISTYAFSNVVAQDEHRVGSHLVASARIGSNADSSSQGITLGYGLTATYGNLQASVLRQSGLVVSSIDAGVTLLPEASDLNYFCQSGLAVGVVNDDPAMSGSSSETRVRVALRSPRARLSGDAWRGRFGASPTLGVFASGLPNSFLSAVGAYAASPNVCDTKAIRPVLLDYTYRPETTRGFSLNYSRRLSEATSLSAFYTVQSQFASSATSVLGATFYAQLPFEQNPFVPLHRWGATFAISNHHLTALLNVIRSAPATFLYKTSDSPRVNAGVGTRFGSGAAFLTVQNLTNAHAGRFAVPTSGFSGYGGLSPIPTTLYPPPPRSFGLYYRFQTTSDENAVAVSDAPEDDEKFTTVQLRFDDLPPPGHRLSLDLITDNSACTPPAQRLARAITTKVTALQSNLEREKRGAVYPSLSPLLATVQGIKINYVPYAEGTKYVLSIDTGVKLGALTQCLDVASDDNSVLRARGLFVGRSDDLSLYVSTAVGYYAASPTDKGDTSTLTYRSEPKEPPSDALGLRSDCPSSVRPLAQALVGAVPQALVSSGATANLNPSSPQLEKRTSRDGSTWLIYKPANVADAFSVLTCINVAALPLSGHPEFSDLEHYTNAIGFSRRYGFFILEK